MKPSRGAYSKQFQKMDCEALIAAVQERPPIWDITNKSHHNRQYLDKLWDEIRKKAGSSKDRCRKKWKYLKDRFRAELRKERIMIKASKSAGSDFKTKFSYFDQMAFMRKQMWIGKTEDQICEYGAYDESQMPFGDSLSTDNLYDPGYPMDQTDTEQFGMTAEYRIPSIVEPEINNAAFPTEENKVPKMTLRVHRKVNKRKVAKRFLEIEERKAELLERIELEKEQPKDSEDLLFFKSLLGFMEMFTPAQNLRVRNKIQTIIIDEINASANYYPNINNKFHV